MEESKENKKKGAALGMIIVAALIGILAVVVYLLTHKTETYIHETTADEKTSALTCVSSGSDSDFFVSEEATDMVHTLKMIYKDGKISKLSYEFTGTYSAEESARQAKGSFNTDYNIYLGKYDIKHEILSPVFWYTEEKAGVKLFLDDYGRMNSVIATFFYIDEASVSSIAKNSIDATKKYYEKKNFSCTISD